MTATFDHDEHRTAQGRAGKPVGAVNPAHSRAHQHDTRQLPGGLFDYLNCNTRLGMVATLLSRSSFHCSRSCFLFAGEHRRRPSLPAVLRQRPVHLFLQGGVIGRTFNSCRTFTSCGASQAYRIKPRLQQPIADPLHLKCHSSSSVAYVQQPSRSAFANASNLVSREENE